MLAGSQHSENVGVANDRAHGNNAPAKRLAEEVEVWNDPGVVTFERGTGAPEATLDFVRNEQDIVFARDAANLA